MLGSQHGTKLKVELGFQFIEGLFPDDTAKEPHEDTEKEAKIHGLSPSGVGDTGRKALP